MSLNSTLKRFKKLIRKTRKNIGISGGSDKKSKFKLSLSATPYIPSSFITPINPVATKAEKDLTHALASSMTGPNIVPDFMSLAMNALTKINAVAMDCEMVGVGEDNKSALAHIAIVDINGIILMNDYVIPKGGITAITDYRTPYSGITKENLERLDKKKHSFSAIKKKALKLLNGKTIVGHALINDFNVLELNMNDFIVWDTSTKSEYQRAHPVYGKQSRKLKNLAAEIGNVIQVAKENRAGHSPVEDARASMNLYRHHVLKLPKIEYANMSK
jgi:hypothetical protein